MIGCKHDVEKVMICWSGMKKGCKGGWSRAKGSFTWWVYIAYQIAGGSEVPDTHSRAQDTSSSLHEKADNNLQTYPPTNTYLVRKRTRKRRRKEMKCTRWSPRVSATNLLVLPLLLCVICAVLIVSKRAFSLLFSVCLSSASIVLV